MLSFLLHLGMELQKGKLSSLSRLLKLSLPAGHEILRLSQLGFQLFTQFLQFLFVGDVLRGVALLQFLECPATIR